ncbi:CTR copper uptake transporter [Mycena rebaudengoi]|nr:CTR copper uptake transporter [Mycena rebaudengoi]
MIQSPVSRCERSPISSTTSHTSPPPCGPPALLLPLLPRALAADNGMDMDMDNGMTLAMGSMINALHFGPVRRRGGHTVSAGAIAGACIGLFVLALVDRWLAAYRAMMERAARAVQGRRGQGVRREEQFEDEEAPVAAPCAPPFIPAHDIMRGALHALQAALGFAFMLAVMFIIAIALGLGVEEMLFGSYAHIFKLLAKLSRLIPACVFI